VQLDVLPVGDIGGVAGEFDRDLTDDAQLLGGESAAVDADAQHEVLVVELPRLERRVLPPSMPGRRWVYSPYHRNAHADHWVNGGEAALGVDVLDPSRTLRGLSSFLDCSLG
jgi:hypothetical protein